MTSRLIQKVLKDAKFQQKTINPIPDFQRNHMINDTIAKHNKNQDHTIYNSTTLKAIQK